MPTYVYACKQCGHTFEKNQSFSDAALTTCPECGGDLRKVYNSVGVTFNGSGFYRTDSRSGGLPAARRRAGRALRAELSIPRRDAERASRPGLTP